ncbi:MAG: HD family phosphohydrolase [Clostridiales bacterium]|jgi:HD superfamily phosphodiesterase|nr:HD family phosphohydrolase [Clostridiales bacterium]
MLTDDILGLAITYNGGDVRRVNHLVKVFTFAHHIGVQEKCDARTQTIIDVSALLHDIGIREAERKHGSASGRRQEIEGPPVARELLKNVGLDAAVTERILFIIGRHHSYRYIDGPDFQILVEADFLVNIFEDGTGRDAIENIKKTIFKTASGTALLQKLYLPG